MGFFTNPKIVYGFHVDGDPEGLHALHLMTENEVKTIFKEAHLHRMAYFQFKTRHFELAHLDEKHSAFSEEIDRYLVAETKRYPTAW